MKAQALLQSNPRIRVTLRNLSHYWEMTKPGVMGVVLMTTLFGFFLGSPRRFDWALLFHTLLGTSFVAAGAGILNMLLEIEPDSLMDRTKNRPLPAGKIPQHHAFFLGGFVASVGIVHLSLSVGNLAGFLSAASLILYLVFYTPMKLSSNLCTAVGSVAGALPPLIGFAASSGRLSMGAWSVFAILFLWQFPHLLALAWMYKDDYSKAGFKMVPIPDNTGASTGKISLIFSVLLFAASLLPCVFRMSGMVYGASAVCLSAIFLVYAVRFFRQRDLLSARKLFIASILYMPFLLAVMAADSL